MTPSPDAIRALLPLPPATFHILLAVSGEDRHGYAIIQDVEARTGGALRLSATPDPRASSYRLELWGASRKTDLLSKVLGAPVEVAAPDGTVVARDGDEATAD